MSIRHTLTCCVLLACLVILPVARADDVTLQGGSQLHGTVLVRGAGAGANPAADWRLLLPGGDELVLHAQDVKAVAYDAQGPQAGEYLRFAQPAAEPGGAPGGLQVALAHFVHPDGGPRVDLVGAVHIADAAFFRAVQRWIDGCDVVLYEGVKKEGQTAADFQKPAEGAPNPIRGLQQKLAGWFDLRFQLDAIEYDRPHFVHADLTEAQLMAGSQGTDGDEQGGNAAPALPEVPGLPRDISQLTTMLQQVGPMLDMLFSQSPEMRTGLKRVFAQVMGRPEAMASFLQAGTPLADLVLHRRNAVVIERLQETVAKQRSGSIAIFYGAAHMADLEKTLVEKLGYRRAGGRWLEAWAIEAGPMPQGLQALQMLMPGLGLPGGAPQGDK